MEQTFDHPPHHPLLERYARKKEKELLKPLRKEFSILLGVSALESITSLIEERPECNLLVFGVGNDSGLWLATNRHRGRTVFLEDHEEWMNKVGANNPGADIRLVRYGTQLREWKSLLNSSENLMLELDEDILATDWDIILVDGPAGSRSKEPGRMKSIFSARQLAKPGANVYINDCNRRPEKAFADKCFGDTTLAESSGRFKSFRRYTV
ncbi:MAG: hypothetical protein ACI8UO_002050 [Verrucomicrobiales bacterium]|jgi:hypothetical protein